MKYFYKIKLSVDLGNVLPPVGEMLKHLNDEMANLGRDEKLMVRSKCLSATVTTERVLTKKDKDTMKNYSSNSSTRRSQRGRFRSSRFAVSLVTSSS